MLQKGGQWRAGGLSKNVPGAKQQETLSSQVAHIKKSGEGSETDTPALQ